MIHKVLSELRRLATLIVANPEADVRGWSVDVVEVSGDSLRALVATYDALIVPDFPREIIEELQKDAVPYREIFYTENPDDTTTRADMVELAAAAALIATKAVPVRNIHMPNIPKSSRRQ